MLWEEWRETWNEKDSPTKRFWFGMHPSTNSWEILLCIESTINCDVILIKDFKVVKLVSYLLMAATDTDWCISSLNNHLFKLQGGEAGEWPSYCCNRHHLDHGHLGSLHTLTASTHSGDAYCRWEYNSMSTTGRSQKRASDGQQHCDFSTGCSESQQDAIHLGLAHKCPCMIASNPICMLDP